MSDWRANYNEHSGTEINAMKIKSILSEVLDALNLPETVARLEEAKDHAGNDMVKMMQLVFPIVTQVQVDIILNHGFPEGRDGIVQFAHLVQTFQKEDSEVAELNARIRSHFLPPMPTGQPA